MSMGLATKISGLFGIVYFPLIMLDRWQMCRDLDFSNHVDHRLPKTPQNKSIKGIFDMYTEN